MRSYVVSTLKGGPGKTTTAFYLALGLALGSDTRPAYRTVAIDADPRSQGLTDWYGLIMRQPEARCPFVVATWPEDADLVAFVRHIADETGADRVVIDTGGERPDVFKRACVYADQLVSPVGPMIGELRRLPATITAAQEVAVHHDLDMAVLLTRVPKAGRGEAVRARDLLADRYGVMRTEITRREREYADAWGTVPARLGEYGQLVDELEADV